MTDSSLLNFFYFRTNNYSIHNCIRSLGESKETSLFDIGRGGRKMSESASATAMKEMNATENVNLRTLITSGKNPRGIPSTIFIVCSSIQCLWRRF